MIAPLLMMIQVAPGTPQRFSILTDPCASAADPEGKDIVVCGRPDAIGPRLPLRDDRGPPDHPMPSNPAMTGTGALAAADAPCAATMGGCTVGFGQPVVAKALELAANGIKDLKDARARHRDGARRVAIDLGEPAPVTAAAHP